MLSWRGKFVVGLMVMAGASIAVPILPSSYDMSNGDGVVSGGSFNYWDLSYSGSGNTSLDNDFLSGGLGDLTDGIIASDNWNVVENIEGTGPYVGWRAGLNGDPQITFYFESSFIFNEITVYVDDSDGNGGVSLPDAVIINGVTYDVDETLAGSEPKSLTFSNLALTSDNIVIDLIASGDWVFASEITFDAEPVPEPVTLAVLGAGLLGFIRRKNQA